MVSKYIGHHKPYNGSRFLRLTYAKNNIDKWGLSTFSYAIVGLSLGLVVFLSFWNIIYCRPAPFYPLLE